MNDPHTFLYRKVPLSGTRKIALENLGLTA
jgi:hypothetical protein